MVNVMSPGLTEEGGETARTLISTMRDSPLTLALVIFNIFVIAIVGYGSVKEREWRTEIFDRMATAQSKYAEMLYNCTPNPNKEHGP
jgi:hypothetical protein